MNIKKTIYLLIILLSYHVTYAQKKKTEPGSDSIIWARVPDSYAKDSIELRLQPADVITYPGDKAKDIIQEVLNNYTKWRFTFNEPQNIKCPLLGRQRIILYLIEPGDSIFIDFKGDVPIFSGKGSLKFQLVQKIEAINDSLEKTEEHKMLSKKNDTRSTLNDYLTWNAYLNKKLNCLLPLIEMNKSKLSTFTYVNLKTNLLLDIEKRRMWKFMGIRRTLQPGLVNHLGLSNQDICAIFDSTMNGPASKWLRYKVPFVLGPTYAWDMLHLDDYRQKGKFFQTNALDTPILGRDPADPFISQYNMAKSKHKGIIREELMAFTFWASFGVLHEIGFTPKVEAILADYYAQPGYPEYKRVVKDYELEQRARWNKEQPQQFTLIDRKGNLFTSEQLKGKIVVFDFWFTGCTGCVQMAASLKNVEDKFKSDTNVVFVSVSIDKNKEQWLKSVKQKMFTTGSGIQLYTGGRGKDHEIIKKFFVEGYPTLEIMDPLGQLLNPDWKKNSPRRDDGKAMTSFIQKQIATMKDGPYILYDSGKVTVHAINGTMLSTKHFSKATIPDLPVQTDTNSIFNISLKLSLSAEPSEFAKPEKLFVLSDIEGNFDAFRKLLQMNKIIDQKFNWTFGNGHLVFAGDMFDRGPQVTECLWLIYSLEEKAKAAGGYVHFILGNHEIMNLQGNHRDALKKYKNNAALIGKSLSQLYNEDSELGKWLRTKNVIEKIGDLLFIHGGISRKINQQPLTVTEINQLAKPYYDDNRKDYGDEGINSIMDPLTSPFWYRAYYVGGSEKKKSQVKDVIDSTLQKFSVNRIITGHTIVADTISVHYGGKVINTDTHHASGKSEALLIERNRYYRVTTMGERILLFSEPRDTFTDITANQNPVKSKK